MFFPPALRDSYLSPVLIIDDNIDACGVVNRPGN